MNTFTKVGLVVAGCVALPTAWCARAYADASPQAACLGTEASYYAPGGNAPFPDGMSQVVHEGLFPTGQYLQWTPGQVVVFFGTTHLGSHDACNAQPLP
jgi:hypothetical protein